MQNKLKIYLDTSVINFIFADDAPELKKVTVEFFESYLDNYKVEISEVVLAEISRTRSDEKKELLYSAINKFKLAINHPINDEIANYAQIFIDSEVIPKNKFEDALHLAFATYYEFDILLSWNFKHLANINKQMKVNSINLQNGYCKQLLLLNPMEVIYEKQ